jgi:hypothetical protein
MKPLIAIVQSQHEQVFAAVRAAASSFREAEVQVEKAGKSFREAEVQIEKAGKRFEGAKVAADQRRLELGKTLIAAHALWPTAKAAQGGARGPGGRTWEQYVEREGLSKATAWRYMKLAGYDEGDGSFLEADEKRPVDSRKTYADLGMDNRPRGSKAEKREPPVAPAAPMVPQAPAEPAPQSPPRSFSLLEGFDLRFGPWQETLYQVGIVDTLISDPPFGAGTHEGSETTRDDGSPTDGLSPDYMHWRPEDVADFVHAWASRVRGWMCCMTSHDLIGAYERAYESVDRYAFAPVPCVMKGMSVRIRNDGPSSWTVYLMVSRPRTAEFARWGTLPGAYIGGPSPEASGGRGKPRWLLDAIVHDYSRQGDLVCDPLAGWGSTLFAALGLGRRAIGSERNPGAHAKAIEAAQVPSDTSSKKGAP